MEDKANAFCYTVRTYTKSNKRHTTAAVIKEAKIVFLRSANTNRQKQFKNYGDLLAENQPIVDGRQRFGSDQFPSFNYAIPISDLNDLVVSAEESVNDVLHSDISAQIDALCQLANEPKESDPKPFPLEHCKVKAKDWLKQQLLKDLEPVIQASLATRINLIRPNINGIIGLYEEDVALRFHSELKRNIHATMAEIRGAAAKLIFDKKTKDLAEKHLDQMEAEKVIDDSFRQVRPLWRNRFVRMCRVG